ncbi:hypothetical protein FB45DRAFT_1030641 [Roridomyces roridus]|uniref:Uncharacterized protein n=1 Tax=Roridomyces roridus TaxID=1738132 RepID=A0AAD7FHD6_9AGAR|nr:hypothetical protein FB45DRAFT_1030641 [Roridomyces roridus]
MDTSGVSSTFTLKPFGSSKTGSDGPLQRQRQPYLTTEPIRMVGRGGVASRPRTLLPTAAQPRPHQCCSCNCQPNSNHLLSPPVRAPTTSAPVQYRPTGRGGAGSRQPKSKPPTKAKLTPTATHVPAPAVPTTPTQSLGPSRVQTLWKGKSLDPIVVSESSLPTTKPLPPLPTEISIPAARPSNRGKFSTLARTLRFESHTTIAPSVSSSDSSSTSLRARRPRGLTLRGRIPTISFSIANVSGPPTPTSSLFPSPSKSTFDLDMDEWTRSMEAQRLASTSATASLASNSPRRSEFSFDSDTTKSTLDDDEDSDAWSRSRSDAGCTTPRPRSLSELGDPDVKYGGSGQWNRNEMDVICRLRGLKA